jgi:hypothetical protein
MLPITIKVTGPPLIVIALLEHESKVNFRASFKFLQYCMLIWDDYEKEMEAKFPGITQTKSFLYPPIIPILFHDGRKPWTALRNFRDRIALKEVFGKYIPSFEYELVDLQTYSLADILKFNDFISLIMLIDRVGSIEGIEHLRKLPPDYFEKLGLKIPPHLTKLLGDVVRVLLDRFDAPKEEIEEITGHIDHKEVRTMFDALVEKYLEMKEEGKTEERERSRREKLEGARKQKALGITLEAISVGFGLSAQEINAL